MFSSKSARAFYDPTINSEMPSDVVEISIDKHTELLTGQSEGKVIAWGDDGFPVLVDPPPPSGEELSATERLWRDSQLAITDSVVTRHRDEVEDGANTTLTAEQYAELQGYRRALRGWPESGEFPFAEHRPAAPAWLVEHLQ